MKIYLLAIIFVLFGNVNVSAYNVPIYTQINNSCATTSMMMVMETWNESHSQTFWDICAQRKQNSPTYYDDMYMCLYNLGYNFKLLDSYYARDLQPKDIVLYHVFGYNNNSDIHTSVVDSVNITNKSLWVANPWGSYDFYTFKEFENIYIGKGIRIKSKRTSWDISFIGSIEQKEGRIRRVEE